MSCASLDGLDGGTCLPKILGSGGHATQNATPPHSLHCTYVLLQYIYQCSTDMTDFSKHLSLSVKNSFIHCNKSETSKHNAIETLGG